MANAENANVADVAENITEQSVTVAGEATAWVSNNLADILIAAGVGGAIALVLLGLRAFGHRLIRNRTDDAKWRIILGRVLAKTSVFFIVMVAAELVAEHAETPPALMRAIGFFFVVAAAFQAAIWIRELILGLVYHRVGEADQHSTLGSAVGIIRLLVSVALFAIAIIVILDNLGVNVTGLVAGLGIGGIAIGLAAQGIFSDLFSALAIIFDKPFRKGDTITFDQVTGTVEQIGLKSTRVRALGGEEVVVSNANLLNKQLQNWAMLIRRRVVMQFGIIYQTSPELLARLPDEIRQIVERQELATFDRGHFFQFGASSIDFELVFFVEAPDYSSFMQARQDIMFGIVRLFAELGVDFAYPTQMGFLGGLDGKAVDPRDIPTHFAPAP